MTVLCVCAIRDRQVDAYNRPFFVPTLGMAVRSFTDEVNRKDAQNIMYAHPEDFELFYVADFDDETADFSNLKEIKSLCVASNVVVKSEV